MLAATLDDCHSLDLESYIGRFQEIAGFLHHATNKLEPRAPAMMIVLSANCKRLAPEFKSIAEAQLKSAAWEQVRKDLLPVIQQVRDRKAKNNG